MAELDLRAKRKKSVAWSEDYFNAGFPAQSRFIDVKNAETGTHARIDMKTAAAYILTLPQWFNALEHSIMLCVWIEDSKSAAPFQYFLDFVEWNNPGSCPTGESLAETVKTCTTNWQQCDNVARAFDDVEVLAFDWI